MSLAETLAEQPADRAPSAEPEGRPLVHVGYPKCASTWLQHQIFANPAFGFHCFGARKDDRRSLTRALWADSFDFDAAKLREFLAQGLAGGGAGLVPALSTESLVGTRQTTGRPYAKSIADKLKAALPDARILMVVREQRAYLYSIYMQAVRGGSFLKPREYIVDFERTEGLSPVPRHDCVALDFVKYDGPVGYYQQLFGTENVLVLPLERLRADARGFVQAIADFAGARIADGATLPGPEKESIPAGLYYIKRPSNVVFSHRPENPLRKLAGFRLTRAYEKLLREFVGPRLPASWNSSAKAKLQREIQSIVGDYYRASNRRLAELTGLDLRALGYDL